MAKSPFLQSVDDLMRVHRYSRRTIDSYLYWIKFFILFNGKQHPSVLDDEAIKRFLTFLARSGQPIRPGTVLLQETNAHRCAGQARYRPSVRFCGKPVSHRGHGFAPHHWPANQKTTLPPVR